MKNFFKTLMVGASLLLSGLITSCDNSLTYEPNPNDSIQVQLVKTPDVIAYSGEQVLGSTFGTRTMNLPAMYATRAAETPADVVKCQDFREKSDWLKGAHPGFYASFDNMPQTTDRGESVSTPEYNDVMKYLQEHPNEGYDEVDLSTYFLQNVGSAGHIYTTTPDQNGVTHTTGMQMDYFNINGWHVSDYNAQGGPRIYIENLPLENCSYHDSFGNNTFSYYKFYYIPLSDGTYGLYLCFDYATISGQGNLEPDGTYDDWVIKIVPGDGIVTPPTTGDNNKDDNIVTTPAEIPGHVEVNLSINDSHDDYVSEDLWSKLSIHVRYGTDVKIRIPLKTKYVCESDDLVILENHYKEIWNTDKHYVEYNINGTIVTLTTSFELDENDITQGWIEVTTKGITDEVIEYLMNENGDGINFEVYLYWQSEIVDENGNVVAINDVSRIELQELLNQSTIEFTNTPPLYVNAFNDKENGDKSEGDCIVDIIDSQKSEYNNPDEGYHYNGSPYNQLYYKESE